MVAIDPEGASMVVAREDGRREMLDLAHLADRHIRPGWVRTIHSAQGATCDRVLANLESFRANTVDARSVYVAISRARMGAAVYTDNRGSLTDALGLRDGAQVGAIDEAMKAPEVATATPATVRAVGWRSAEPPCGMICYHPEQDDRRSSHRECDPQPSSRLRSRPT